MNTFDPSYILQALPKLATKIPLVLIIVAVSTMIGMLVGLLFAVIRIQHIKVLDPVTVAVISFLRGTPQIVQLFIVYYGIPQLLEQLGIDVSDVSRTVFVIITFALNSSAMFAESFRSAYLAVDRGQIEAAYSVGMTRLQMFKNVLFPQAFLVLLPNLGNLIVRLLQSTSLAFTIGLVDLMGEAKLIDGRTYGVRRLEIYIAVSLIYWGICLAIEFVVHELEMKFTKGKTNIANAGG